MLSARPRGLEAPRVERPAAARHQVRGGPLGISPREAGGESGYRAPLSPPGERGCLRKVRQGLLRVDAGAGAFGGGPELFADLVDEVDEFLALGHVVGLLGFAGDLGRVPHQLVD